MSIKAYKLMFLCLRLFPPDRESVHMVLRSHLAAKAVRGMTRFVGFSSVAGATAHCWEALDFAVQGFLHTKEVSLEVIEEFVVRFLNLPISDLINSIIQNLASCYMTIKVGNGTVNCEIPDIPANVRALFPYESKIGQIRAQDLADEICRLANLGFQAVFQCENPPSALDRYLVGDSVLPGNCVLADVLYDVRDRSAGIRWKMVKADQVAMTKGGSKVLSSVIMEEEKQ
jgi:hypothetical protein